MSSPTMNVMLPFFGAPSPEDVFLETVRFQVPSLSLSTERLQVADINSNNDPHGNSSSIVVYRKKRAREGVESKQSKEHIVNDNSNHGSVNDKSKILSSEDLTKCNEHIQTRNKSFRNECAVECKDLMNLLEYAHFHHHTPWNLLLVRYTADLQESSTRKDFRGSTATSNVMQNENVEQTFTALSLYEQVEFARSALRHALSVIARLVHLDTLGFFTFATVTTIETDQSSKQDNVVKEELQVVESKDVEEDKVASSAEYTNTDKQVRSLLTLYCKIQALELELNDLVLQIRDDRWESKSSNNNKTGTYEKDATLRKTLRTIELCVNALEATIIDILLALPLHDTPIAGNANVNNSIADTSNNISVNDMPSHILSHIQQTHLAELNYIVQIVLESLPDVCQTLNWPCQLVHSGRINSNSSSNYIEKTESEIMRGRSAANAITSIVLQSMLELKKNDCNRVFQETSTQFKFSHSHSPLLNHQQHQEKSEQSISVLAALQLVRNNDTRNLLLSEQQITFNEFAAKAWRGAYSTLGIRIAMMEMRLMFYKQYRILIEEIQIATTNIMRSKNNDGETNKGSTAANKHGKVSTTSFLSESAKSKQNVMWILEKLTHLREQEMYWKRSLQTNYANFLSNCVEEKTDYRHGKWEHSELLLLENNIFDILQTSNAISSTNAEISELQQICLRVIKRLREVDKKGWFAIPAFDLVNIDFTSVEMWIRSKSFANKSHRAAFEALRAVLEQMVDNCVAQYGPTHEFSLLITTVRQEFVSIARQEKLL